MKSLPSAVQTYLESRKALIDRNYIWITLISGATYGFCDGDIDETVNVIDPTSGSSVSRAYLGGGHIANIPDLTDTPDLSIRDVQLTLSTASASVMAMVTSADLRGAAVEWHKGFVSEDTFALLADPTCEFLGFVDRAPISEPAIPLDGEGYAEPIVALECVSVMRELTRTNTNTRSYQAGLERSGDEIFKYCNSAHRWKIRWGKEMHSHDEGRGGKGKGKTDNLNGGNPSR